MKQLSIALTPAGHFLLTFPGDTQSHSVVIPATEAGTHLLANTVRDWTELARIGREAPTGHQITEALRGASWGEPKALFGKYQRRADIKAATGITVRQKKLSKKDLEAQQLRATLREQGLI